MAIKKKSIFEPRTGDDGLRILITRYYPRGVRKESFDEWVISLSPSPWLLSGYKEGRLTWNKFKESFLVELANSFDSQEAIQALGDESKVSDITLLCYERTGMRCHRHLVKDVIESPDILERFRELNQEPVITKASNMLHSPSNSTTRTLYSR